MNKDKELEEAIKQLKDLVIDRASFIQNDSDHDDIFLKDKKAIEIALEALTDARKQYQEGYLRGRKEEQEKAKQFIEENLIFKTKIEKLIDDLYADDNTIYGTIRIIEMLQELLEDK